MATLETAPNGDSIIRVSDFEIGVIICALQEYRDSAEKDCYGNTIIDAEIQGATDLLAVIHTS